MAVQAARRMQGRLHVQKVIPVARRTTATPLGFPVTTPLSQVGSWVNGHANTTGAPGRTRTDTSDPFRGAASALGLRGLSNNTPQLFIIEESPYPDWQLFPGRLNSISHYGVSGAECNHTSKLHKRCVTEVAH